MKDMSGAMDIRQVVLEGNHIRLEPLALVHHSALCEIGLDPELWKLTMARIEGPEHMMDYIQTALKWQQDGTAVPFVIREKVSGKIVGSTRFANIDRSNRRLEIGWTWIARPWQRTIVNTEMKYLLLKHAFELLGCIRVEFKTDSLNSRSRTALLRIGAKEEGIFRNHMITPSGRIRHSVYFSIIDSEWNTIKLHLEEKMNHNSPRTP